MYDAPSLPGLYKGQGSDLKSGKYGSCSDLVYSFYLSWHSISSFLVCCCRVSSCCDVVAAVKAATQCLLCEGIAIVTVCQSS